MFKRLSAFKDSFQNRQNAIETDLAAYQKVLAAIKNLQLDALSEGQLKEMAGQLKREAQKGAAPDDLLVEVFALGREASRRLLGITAFDVQIMAAVALHQGKLVEMQTGEGKTWAAVLPALLNGLAGKGVHVLTFNDYLVCRDHAWMGPVYHFLGLTTAYIQEGMSTEARRKAYAADITYVTAKEAGFDYLRDFLCVEPDRLVHRPFNYALVDEADSILIDEARIPLVIAGKRPQAELRAKQLADLVRKLRPGEDYKLDQYANNVYLTDDGLNRVEKLLGVVNLYHPEHLDLLTRVNSALHAETLIKRDIDYIVRQERVELVDEFTGRVAEKRHWPENLQAAVEAKEGLASHSKGEIMGSITLQNFLRLYPKISGMTGTARAAAAEFNELYGMNVVVIPTHRPCVRLDHPDQIFTHQEAKQKAILAEIVRAHAIGQPILVGTGSVAESENLARKLKEVGIECQVLNAKNDEKEAAIISRAGEPGAVTVSTNMAGRGIDIKLGGADEQERKRVVTSGGLNVIVTNRHESTRIDHQLRGRAGRQGDPGESRFFISLEDDLIQKYDLTQLIPAANYPTLQEGPLKDPLIDRELARGQRFIEGYNSDLRRQLWRYAYLIEQQRQIIHRWRQAVLHDKGSLKVLASQAPERYQTLLGQVGEAALWKAEKQLTLYQINKCWAEYLDYITYIRESVHLMVLGRCSPIDEYHKLAVTVFAEMQKQIEAEVVKCFNLVEITAEGVDLEKEGLKGPASTLTYLIDDSPDQFSRLPFLIKLAKNSISGPILKLQTHYHHLFGKGNGK